MELTLKEFIESKAEIKNGKIKNVHILGFESKNKRTYEKAAVKEAVSLYEGVHVYVNHADGPRNVADKFGSLSNVRYDDTTGLWGDLNYLENHPQAKSVKEDIERDMGLYGLSHNVKAKGENRSGKNYVTKIGKVESVDLVSEPSTCKKLLESVGDEQDFEVVEEGKKKDVIKDPPQEEKKETKVVQEVLPVIEKVGDVIDFTAFQVFVTEQFEKMNKKFDEFFVVKEEVKNKYTEKWFSKPQSTGSVPDKQIDLTNPQALREFVELKNKE